jgi:hypothetical protein
MKHASAETLRELEPLLAQVRRMDSLCERKPGIFYLGSSAFLHFHEDPAGLFADVKLGGQHFERMPVSSERQRREFIAAVRKRFCTRSRG